LPQQLTEISLSTKIILKNKKMLKKLLKKLLIDFAKGQACYNKINYIFDVETLKQLYNAL